LSHCSSKAHAGLAAAVTRSVTRGLALGHKLV
jgi:hypothetical protein